MILALSYFYTENHSKLLLVSLIFLCVHKASGTQVLNFLILSRFEMMLTLLPRDGYYQNELLKIFLDQTIVATQLSR